MKFAADTSALLSLACSRYFSIALKTYTVTITPSVSEELKQFARYDDFLGLKAKEVIKKGLKTKKPKTIIDLNLEKAEEEVFSLAKEEKCMALSDDVHAARIAKIKLSLEVKPSIHLLFMLYKKGKVEKGELIEDIKLMGNYRNWLGGALWEYAVGLIEKILK